MRARVARCWCEREALLRDMPRTREKCFICFVCGIGYPARLCSSDGWVNDLKEEALEGEHINEDGYWTEEDDEILQLVYLGIDAGVRSPLPSSPTSPFLPSLPPLPRGLHDASRSTPVQPQSRARASEAQEQIPSLHEARGR